MPEASSDASILIAVSWQALNRTIQNDKETVVCDSTVVILFAAFFIEANLDHIIDKLGIKEEMLDFLYGKKRQGEKYPGLQAKLGWFYNSFIENSPMATKNQKYKAGIRERLGEKFPGFEVIYEFRNKISHGEIQKTVANREDAEILRQQAKDIVNELFDIFTAKTGYNISRDVTYKNAITLD
ncbi:MAG TPA: hypothetical protein VFG81_00125 [Anaerolineales bacterium]|nr:hypothetical protein [Anaerolineales bacterium]